MQYDVQLSYAHNMIYNKATHIMLYIKYGTNEVKHIIDIYKIWYTIKFRIQCHVYNMRYKKATHIILYLQCDPNKVAHMILYM